MTRTLGADGARPDWPATTGRLDAQAGVMPTHHPDGASAPGPVPRVGDQPDAVAQVDGVEAAAVAFPRSYAQFEINKETQRLSIKIVDAVTREVIRTIPSEEVQRISEELQALARRDAIGKPQPGGVGGDGSKPTASGGVDRYV